MVSRSNIWDVSFNLWYRLQVSNSANEYKNKHEDTSINYGKEVKLYGIEYGPPVLSKYRLQEMKLRNNKYKTYEA